MYIRSKAVRKALRVIVRTIYVLIAMPIVFYHFYIPLKYPAEMRSAAFKALVLEQKVLKIPTETALHKNLSPRLAGT